MIYERCFSSSRFYSPSQRQFYVSTRKPERRDGFHVTSAEANLFWVCCRSSSRWFPHCGGRLATTSRLSLNVLAVHSYATWLVHTGTLVSHVPMLH